MLKSASSAADRPGSTSIWYFAFGYFACYVPYSALTKALSKGWVGDAEPIVGAALLPITTVASVVGMFAFISTMRWWRFASQFQVGGLSIPRPGRWTLLSGICTAAIIATTTLAYTFEGVSIVFVMLLMRGGVLVTAPIVDAVSGRTTRWYSWVGLALSLGALVVAFSEEGGYAITTACTIDISIYLLAYFIRLRLMTRMAKSDDADTTKRYFVEEQMVGGPVLVVLLALWAAFGTDAFAGQLRSGYWPEWDHSIIALAILIGLLSQGTGIFGGLVLLDRGENTFSVPVNRSSSILAGVVASTSLWLFLDAPAPSLYQLAGAGLVVGAIVALSMPPLLAKRRAAQ